MSERPRDDHPAADPLDAAAPPVPGGVGPLEPRPRGGVFDLARQTVAQSHELGRWVAELTRDLQTPEEQAAQTVQAALAALRADAVLLFRVAGDDPEVPLVLHASANVPGEAIAALAHLPAGHASPMGEAAHTGAIVTCGSAAEMRDRWPAAAELAESLHAGALCAVPVRHLGQVRGVLALSYAAPRRFDRGELTMLRSLGARYARALHTSRLYFAEHAARGDAEMARREAEAARRALGEAHAALERRVEERTAELAQANARLAGEMMQRERAEVERNTLRRQLAEAEESERRRLARELHDQLGQHLTAFALGLAEARRLLDAGESAAGRLHQLEELAGAMTRDARYLALELRPPELDDVGFEGALETYVREWCTRYGVAAEVAVTGLSAHRPLPADVGSTLYRITQEALTNVAKHAKASHVSVVVDKREGEARLIVEDDGRGFDMHEATARGRRERRLGLSGMRERAALAGGTLEVESSADRGGTTIYVRLPLADD